MVTLMSIGPSRVRRQWPLLTLLRLSLLSLLYLPMFTFLEEGLFQGFWIVACKLLLNQKDDKCRSGKKTLERFFLNVRGSGSTFLVSTKMLGHCNIFSNTNSFFLEFKKFRSRRTGGQTQAKSGCTAPPSVEIVIIPCQCTHTAGRHTLLPP